MRRTSIWIVSLATALLIGASAFVLADLGGNGDSNQNVNIVRDPPQDVPCYCPAIWDPVVCKGADGAKHAFSNACVAGCYGYTRCLELAIQPAHGG